MVSHKRKQYDKDEKVKIDKFDKSDFRFWTIQIEDYLYKKLYQSLFENKPLERLRVSISTDFECRQINIDECCLQYYCQRKDYIQLVS